MTIEASEIPFVKQGEVPSSKLINDPKNCKLAEM